MNSILDILSKLITSEPDIIQFSKDRKYEDAWIINKMGGYPSEQNVAAYLAKEKFNVLIVEYIWNEKDDDNRFVLTLFLDKKCHLKDPNVFISICLKLYDKYPGFNDFINEINNKIVGRPYLFRYPIEEVNMGIFNHWLSVGPVDLWKYGADYNRNDIETKINLRPEIKESTLNYQGLLFRFNVSGKDPGPYYGVKTPCCNKITDRWVVNFDKVHYWMSHLI